MIRIPKTIYKKFLRFALENADPYNSYNWKECIGLILGRITDEIIYVTDIVPIGTGTAVFVDITDYEKVFSLISLNRIEQGEVIVGWAHTHPGLGLFLSGTDIHTQRLYQQMHPKAFALVMDHTKVSSKSSGFNIFRLDESRSHVKNIDYCFDETFDFLEIRDILTNELYPFPQVPIPIPPVIISETEVSWNDIRVLIDGETDIQLDKAFQVKILVNLPYRQFIRLEYNVEIDNLIKSSFSQKVLYNKTIHNETINSGTLGIFNLHPTNTGIAYVRIKNLILTNYKHEPQQMPDLNLKIQIHKE